MESSADIVVIGGGIWGLSTAYHLGRTGRAGSVVVVERNSELADETTRQAAGQIGQLRATQVMARGVAYTLDLLSGFEQETGHDPGFCRSGSLHLALNRERLAAFQSQLAGAAELGIDVQLASDALIARLAPTIDQSQIEGAIHLPNDGYVESRQCAQALAAAACDLGVRIELNTTATGFEFRHEQLVAVHTDNATIETSVAVITAGPWTRVVAEMAGFAAPVQPIRLQQVRTRPDPHLTADHPVVRIPDHSCYLRPERGGYLYGFFDPDPLAIELQEKPPGFRTRDIKPPINLMNETRRKLSQVFPVLGKLEIDEYRQGMVTCTPDGEYVIGPVPATNGLWLGTGCGAMGIAGSAPVGRWLSNWILDGDPGDDLSALRLDRFGQLGSDLEWLRQQARRTCANYYSLSKGKTYTSAR